MNARLVVTAAVLLGLAACGGDPPRTMSGAGPRTADFAYDDTGVPIEPGTYRVPRSPWSAVDFTVRFPQGWTAQYGHVYAGTTSEKTEHGFYAVVVDEIFADACHRSEVVKKVAPGTDALVAALRHQPGPRVSKPVRTTIGGRPAVRLELRVPKGLDLGGCRLALDGVDGLQIWKSVPADKYFVLLPDSVYTAHIVDVDGRHQVFLSSYRTATSAADRAELQQVLDSIRIDS
jgi:hypothetical protein